MTDLFLKIKVSQEQNLPFVVFCKPNSNRIVGLFQKNDHLYFLEKFNEKGFVFAPFDKQLIPFIPLEHSMVMVDVIPNEEYFVQKDKNLVNINFGKDYFENLVSKAVSAIQENKFSKVVLSRKEEMLITDFNLELAMQKMISLYPNAFRYLFYHPKIGTWMGATPEQFVKIKGSALSTVALAGTQLAKGDNNPVWQEKEKKEQQFVTDFIVESLDDMVKEITVSQPYSVKAGNLWHLKTDVSAKLKSQKLLQNIIEALHPTPAVCGLPKQSAKDFILKNEGYDREYYSGFLGELNIDLSNFNMKQSDLFVNLRCMKVEKNKAQLFVGCGITSESNPQAEYVETANKTLTMKRILTN